MLSSHEIKRCLLLGRKAMMTLNSIFKSKDNTLPTKVCMVKAMVFPVVMYRCWAVKKVESGRIDVFELWRWRRLLRVPWTARRSNQSVLKKINPEYSLEGLMLKLKLQYFCHLMWRADSSLEKTLMLGKIEHRRKRGRQRMRCLDGITDSMDMSLTTKLVLCALDLCILCLEVPSHRSSPSCKAPPPQGTFVIQRPPRCPSILGLGHVSKTVNHKRIELLRMAKSHYLG